MHPIIHKEWYDLVTQLLALEYTMSQLKGVVISE